MHRVTPLCIPVRVHAVSRWHHFELKVIMYSLIQCHLSTMLALFIYLQSKLQLLSLVRLCKYTLPVSKRPWTGKTSDVSLNKWVPYMDIYFGLFNLAQHCVVNICNLCVVYVSAEMVCLDCSLLLFHQLCKLQKFRGHQTDDEQLHVSIQHFIVYRIYYVCVHFVHFYISVCWT